MTTQEVNYVPINVAPTPILYNQNNPPVAINGTINSRRPFKEMLSVIHWNDYSCGHADKSYTPTNGMFYLCNFPLTLNFLLCGRRLSHPTIYKYISNFVNKLYHKPLFQHTKSSPPLSTSVTTIFLSPPPLLDIHKMLNNQLPIFISLNLQRGSGKEKRRRCMPNIYSLFHVFILNIYQHVLIYFTPLKSYFVE